MHDSVQSSIVGSKDKLLDRRHALLRLGIGAGALLFSGSRWSASAAASGSPSCVLTPQQTEGPFFIDERLYRSDIRTDPSDGSVRPGTPLLLTIALSEVATNRCTPLAGATVEVWHCDAAGNYSDVKNPGFNAVGKKFLRGYQITDEHGLAQFTSIYPGWYPGRAVHIHFKLRRPRTAGEFTSQLYFDDSVTDRVHRATPYNSKGPRDTRNAGDTIFHQGGSQLMVRLAENGEAFTARFDVGLRNA